MSSTTSEDEFESADEGDVLGSDDSEDDEIFIPNESCVSEPAVSVDFEETFKQSKRCLSEPDADVLLDAKEPESQLCADACAEEFVQVAIPVSTEQPVPDDNDDNLCTEEFEFVSSSKEFQLSSESVPIATVTVQPCETETKESSVGEDGPVKPCKAEVVTKDQSSACENVPIEEEAKESSAVEAPSEPKEELAVVLEAAIPSEIAIRISTRKVPIKERPKSRPTLGGKKLGGVRLPPTNIREENVMNFGTSPSQLLHREEDVALAKTNLTTSPSPVNQEPRQEEKAMGGGWGWFAPPKSLLSSVSSLTNQILATVEGGLNIPEPEDLAREEAVSEGPHSASKTAGQVPPSSLGLSQLMGGVGNLTSFFENTGSKVLFTSLDTLELLGKKTINVLQQTDPGLKKTKESLINPLLHSQDKLCLSQLLREAKDAAPDGDCPEPQPAAAQIPVLATLFEEYNGTVHMEALRILSASKLQPRSPTEEQVAIKRLCTEWPELDEDEEPLQTPESFQASLVECWNSIRVSQVPLTKLIDAVGRLDSPEEPYSQALQTMASVAAFAVAMIRKGLELLLSGRQRCAGGLNEAQAFHRIVLLVCGQITSVASLHAESILTSGSSDGEDRSTDIYLEASKSCLLVQNAVKLIVPILQSRI